MYRSHNYFLKVLRPKLCVFVFSQHLSCSALTNLVFCCFSRTWKIQIRNLGWNTKFHGNIKQHSLFPVAPTLEHRASVKRFVSLQFLNPKTVGRTPWTSDQPVARPLPACLPTTRHYSPGWALASSTTSLHCSLSLTSLSVLSPPSSSSHSQHRLAISS
jgi:hypothetical protein